MIWFISLFLFTGTHYYSKPVFPTFKSETECREAAAKLEMPEMPAPNTPPSSWPKNGWRCLSAGG